MYKVLVIVGPTAIGKSSLGIELAKKYNGEIINGDSVSVYKELNIGSAKTTIEQQKGVSHHLLDYKEVCDDYSVAHFQTDGRKAIEDICSRGKLPIVVGGTGLYIKALLYDYNFVQMDAVEKDYSGYTNEQLHAMLKEIDEPTSKTIHPNNRKRVIRALEIAESGNIKSDIEANQQHTQVYDSKIIALTVDREVLKERIDLRVDQMIEEGLEKEVIDLFDKYGYEQHCFSAIGYKEFIGYYKKTVSLQETVNLIKTHTRQFAKRQYTWFNHQMNVDWFDIADKDMKNKIYTEIDDFLQK